MRFDFHQVLWLLITVLLVALTLPACNRGEQPGDESSNVSQHSSSGEGESASGENRESSGTAEESEPGDPGYILQDHNRGAALGEKCHQDQECLQPLRCLELQCIVPPAVAGEGPSLGEVVLDVGGKNETTVQVEVADTDFERRRGLMFRTSMAEDWGMLFVFDRSRPRSFWMKNTYLPLDILFISEAGKIVAISEHAKPLDVGPRYESGDAAKYVLELNAGFAGRNGIRAGQQVKLKQVQGRHSPEIQ